MSRIEVRFVTGHGTGSGPVNFVAVVHVVLLVLFALTLLATMLLGAWTLLSKMLDRWRSPT